MKPLRFPRLFLTLILAATAVGGWLRAEDPPATPPPAAPAGESPVAPPPEAPKAEEALMQAEKNLRDAEAAVAKARAETERLQAEAKSAVDQEKKQAEEAEKPAAGTKRDRRAKGAGDRFVVADDNHIEAGTTIPHDAIAIMGDLTIDGEVLHDAVAVMGDNTVNGHVHHNVVAIMGDIRLGPKAVVDGDLICVGGDIHRDPGAVVGGRAVIKTPGPNFKSDQFSNWWDHALKIGRPLAIGAHLGWLWVLTGFSIAFYALLGLLFPKRITACGDKLVQEPGLVLLSAVLAVLALPVLFVLLCITIIGLPVALLVLPVSCLVVAMFGKAAIYGLIGRKLTGDRFHPAVAVILGAGLFVLLYLLPVLGLLLSLLVWFVGFGCAVLLMFGRSKLVAPLVPPPAAGSPVAASAIPPIGLPVPDAAPVASSPFGSEPPPIAATSAARSVAAMVVTADTMPRAGFWIRVAAALLDFVMLVIPLGMLGAMSNGPGFLFLGLAAYHVIMWQLKGTTIGGVICGLKVVRLDDRPLDWGVAIVRALSGFLSFFLAGLGFIWVAFDDEKQSWHDKIAGTTIVHVPKGTALL